MKKKELNIIFLFLVIPFLSFAQKKFVSFKMGPMFSQANAKPPATLIAGFEDQPFLGHINVGASISRINLLNKKWGIEWGLAYYNIGYKEKEVPFTADLKRRAIFNSQYFSLPFSIKYFLKEQQRAAIYLGHAFSWMAAQKREVARISNIGTSVNEYKNADAYHRLNYFVFIGANWSVKIDDRFDFVADLQFLRSILGFNKHDFGDPAFYHIAVLPAIGLRYLIE